MGTRTRPAKAETRQRPAPLKRHEADGVTYDATSGGLTNDVILEAIDRPVYKFLGSDGLSPYQHTPWPLPTKNPDGTWTPGAWMEEPGKLVTCQSGLHVTYAYTVTVTYGDTTAADDPRRIDWGDQRCFEAEVDGPVLHSPSQHKMVAHRVRLVREIEGWELHARYANAKRHPNSLIGGAEYSEYEDTLRATYRPLLVAALRANGYEDEATRLETAADPQAVLSAIHAEEWRRTYLARLARTAADATRKADMVRNGAVIRDNGYRTTVVGFKASPIPYAGPLGQLSLTDSYAAAAYAVGVFNRFAKEADSPRFVAEAREIVKAIIARRPPTPTFDELFPPSEAEKDPNYA